MSMLDRTPDPVPPEIHEAYVALTELAMSSLSHFEAMDRANAEINLADVRYRPITVALATALHHLGFDNPVVTTVLDAMLGRPR